MVILVCEVNCMYLRRKIDDYLKEWKNSEERKPLIIKGARQIERRSLSVSLQKKIILRL